MTENKLTDKIHYLSRVIELNKTIIHEHGVLRTEEKVSVWTPTEIEILKSKLMDLVNQL